MDVTSARDRAVAFLLGRIDYERALAIPYSEREFRLDRMRSLLERLGNPQDRLKIVHVAGTKGKGSTSAMIAAMLSAAGIRTGLYTSPHLDRLEERLMVDCQPCSPAELAALVEQIRPVVEQMDTEGGRQSPPDPRATYFEITTAMALLHFAQVNTGAAVLEVGLGGRLDSTNVCQPLVSVITSISFDHTKQLGNTLAKIAAEKAGIIKPGIPVVSGVIDDEPRGVIDEFAKECGCRLLQAGVDFSYQYQPPRELDCGELKFSQSESVSGAMPTALRGHDGAAKNMATQSSGHGTQSSALLFRGTMDYIDNRSGTELLRLELGLLGRHQAANAAVALAAIGVLQQSGWNLPEVAIRKGLAEVQLPARVEMVGRRPTIIVDGAHNTASIESLLATLDESFTPKRRILVFATTQDKDVRGMLALLLPKFDHIILTEYHNNPRVMKMEDLAALAAELSPKPIQTAPTSLAAWELASRLASPDDLICITGSFFLAAEMRCEMANGLG